eukprot:8163490-Pyramimonas_sp.AAC.1
MYLCILHLLPLTEAVVVCICTGQVALPGGRYSVITAQLPFVPPSDDFDVGLALALGFGCAVLGGFFLGGTYALRRFRKLQVKSPPGEHHHPDCITTRITSPPGYHHHPYIVTTRISSPPGY